MELWSKCLSILRDNLEPEQFSVWFEPIVAVSYKDNKLTIKLPSQYFVQQIENNYFQLFSSVLRRVYGQDVKLFYSFNTFVEIFYH